MRNWKVAAGTFVGLVLVLTGCSGDADKGSDGPASAANSSAEQVRALGGDSVAFGEAYRYEDGLTLTISGPEEFTPSPKAKTGGEGNFVKFTLQVDNGTAKKFKPASVTVTVTSGGGQAGDVLDKKQGMTLAPGKPVKPGGQISWVQGFGVIDPQDVAVVVEAGMDRAPLAVTR
jgi:hypothetical protein